ncbi:MAG: carbohydrate-binding family 9-like protein [Thermoproteota archaeon]
MEKLPRHICVRVKDADKENDFLRPTSWLTANFGRLRNWNGTGEVKHTTIFMTKWDEEALYVIFINEDKNIWASYTNKGAPIYLEEVNEVFIDPSRSGKSYYEIEISPKNVLWEGYILYDEKPKLYSGWNPKNLKSRVNIFGRLHEKKNNNGEGKFWISELKIPFEDLNVEKTIKPNVGDVWKINFFRIERMPLQQFQNRYA